MDDAFDRLLSRPEIARLARSLREKPGTQLALDDPMRRAAVALIIRDVADGPTVLMIQRATCAGDPGSGQIALPGGRRETGDASLEATAIRETREETGVDLAAHGRILGRLDELQPSTPVLPAIAIAPYVALYAGDATLALSDEVHDAFWVPMARLTDSANWSDVELEIRGARRTFPAFRHGEHIVWGLTERILSQFRARLAE